MHAPKVECENVAYTTPRVRDQMSLLFVYPLFNLSARSQIPHNSVITRKQPAATAQSSLVVANCLHVRTCGIEANVKIVLVFTNDAV